MAKQHAKSLANEVGRLGFVRTGRRALLIRSLRRMQYRGILFRFQYSFLFKNLSDIFDRANDSIDGSPFVARFVIHLDQLRDKLVQQVHVSDRLFHPLVQ